MQTEKKSKILPKHLAFTSLCGSIHNIITDVFIRATNRT